MRRVFVGWSGRFWVGSHSGSPSARESSALSGTKIVLSGQAGVSRLWSFGHRKRFATPRGDGEVPYSFWVAVVPGNPSSSASEVLNST